jgi:hypothetical protein
MKLCLTEKLWLLCVTVEQTSSYVFTSFTSTNHNSFHRGSILNSLHPRSTVSLTGQHIIVSVYTPTALTPSLGSSEMVGQFYFYAIRSGGLLLWPSIWLVFSESDWCKIRGSLNGIAEDWGLVVCDVVSLGEWLPAFRLLVLLYSYAPHNDVSVNIGPHIRRYL